MHQYITLKTNGVEFIDISKEVRGVLNQSGIKDGTCFVHVPHTTCGLTLNEFNAKDMSVAIDTLRRLTELIPHDGNYTHQGNADAHIKAILVGQSVVIPIIDGKLELGHAQAICFCEFAGAYERKVLVKINKD